jgi:hypothetical protein
MARSILVALIGVALMATSAQAVFSDDFESYSIGSTVTDPPWEAPWGEVYGPQYPGGQVIAGNGTNTSNVVDLVDSSAWGNMRTSEGPADPCTRGTLALENQYRSGSIQFDYQNPDGGFGYSNLRLFVGGTQGRIVDFNFRGDDIHETAGCCSDTDPANNADDIIPAFPAWVTLRIDFDNDAPGGNGFWQLSMDGFPILSGVSDLSGAGGAAGQDLLYVTMDCGSGDSGLIDNFLITPEPVTCLLLASGMVLLRRRRA